MTLHLAGSSVAQLKATDPEGEPLIYGVSGEEAMRYFSVNKDTGVVWLRQQLDREVGSRHLLLQLHEQLLKDIYCMQKGIWDNLKVADRTILPLFWKWKDFFQDLICVVALSALLLHSMDKLYADVFLCLHQVKSEMQVEFYVSDIQEVRDRYTL